MAQNANNTRTGTTSSDNLVYTNGYTHYFGLQGDDLLEAYGMPINISVAPDLINFMAGGSGSDTYKWNGIGSFFLVDTAGDNDTFVDTTSYANTGLDSAAEVDGTHLALWDEYGNQAVYINYKDPSFRIENFYIQDSDTSSSQHYTHDQFVNMVKSSEGWIGSVSYEQLGFGSYVASEYKERIADVIRLDGELEDGGTTRTADADDVAVIGRLYTAAFDRTPDLGGLNFWVDQWEGNMDTQEISARFYDSAEFQSMYGFPTQEAYVDLLYGNVLNRSADSGGLDYWIGEITGGMSRAEVLARFSDSAENIENTVEIFSGLHDDGQGYWLF